VNGAVGLAEKLGVSPLIVGLTVVAMGTSAPEVAASIAAAFKGLGDTAIGNVYGSNIANLALVGGLCAVIRPISVRLSVIRRELPVMLIVGLILYPVLVNMSLGRGESIILLLLFFSMILFTVINAKTSKDKEQLSTDPTAKPAKNRSTGANTIFILIGLVALAVGADLTIRGAVFIGKSVGLSDAVIGLTIIALGTSLPELMTCVVASFKGHDDISIGNLVGSNVFNTLLVVGTAGAIRPFGINARLIGTDYWVMILVSAVFIAMVMIGKKIKRSDGVALITIYVSYMLYVLVFSREI